MESGVDVEAVRCDECPFEGGWSDFALAVRAVFGSLGTPVGVMFVVLGFEESVSRRLPRFNEGARLSWGCVLSPPSLDIPSKLFDVGRTPGPTLFRGARAAGFNGAWAGNWLWRRVRMAMFVAGGGMEEVSEAVVLPDAVDAPLGFLAVDWLNRRMNELLRVGRASVAGAPEKFCMLGMLVFGTAGLLKLPGAGKSLRLGSYERLFAKSSKLTEGRKSYVSVGSTGSLGSGSGCFEKLKRGFDGPERALPSLARVGRKERFSTEATLVPLAILHSYARISCHVAPLHASTAQPTLAWRSPAVALAAPAAPCSWSPAAPGWCCCSRAAVAWPT